MKDENRNVRLDEIARALSVPRHFLGKIMMAVVKAGVLKSARGQGGGFYLHDDTLQTPLIKVVLLTEGKNYFDTCLLSLRKCNATNPCPLHNKVDMHKQGLMQIYQQTTIGDLMKQEKPEFIRSIALGE